VSGYIDSYIFLASALVGREWSASRPCRFIPGERAPRTNLIGGWVGPGTGLNDMKKRIILPLPGLESRPLCRPVGSQSLYRPRYPGFFSPMFIQINSIHIHPIPFRSILILFVLRLGFPSGLYLSGFSTRTLHAFLFSLIHDAWRALLLLEPLRFGNEFSFRLQVNRIWKNTYSVGQLSNHGPMALRILFVWIRI
jgi:hypothetical protein